jgi:hypothetical protein
MSSKDYIRLVPVWLRPLKKGVLVLVQEYDICLRFILNQTRHLIERHWSMLDGRRIAQHLFISAEER